MSLHNIFVVYFPFKISILHDNCKRKALVYDKFIYFWNVHTMCFQAKLRNIKH